MSSRRFVENRRGIRLLVAARYLLDGGEVTSRWLQKRFGICARTSRYDLEILRQYFPVDMNLTRHAPNYLRAARLRLAESARQGAST